MYAGVKEVIERTQPEVLAIEKLFYQHNQTTVIGVAEARGVMVPVNSHAEVNLCDRSHPVHRCGVDE